MDCACVEKLCWYSYVSDCVSLNSKRGVRWFDMEWKDNEKMRPLAS
jgi:hypothetical protein